MKIIIITIILGFILRNIRKIREYRKNNSRYYQIKTIKNFNLGSSHSFYGFENEENITNLSNISQSFYYDYIILKKYFDKIENGGKCFLCISYFSFASKEIWIEEDLEKYFYILDITYFEGKYKFYYLIYKYLPVFKKCFKLTPGKNKELIDRIKGHHKMLKDKKNREFSLEYAYKIIEKCQEKDIEVILLTTPFMKEYNDYFTEKDLKENFYSIIDFLKDKYGLNYIDLSHRYDIFGERDDFRPEDYDHLSKKGAKKLIKYLNNIYKFERK